MGAYVETQMQYMLECPRHGRGRYEELELIRLASAGRLGRHCCRISVDGKTWESPDALENIRLAFDLSENVTVEPAAPEPVTALQRIGLALVVIGCLAALMPCGSESIGGEVRYGIQCRYGIQTLLAGVPCLVLSLFVRTVGRWLWGVCGLAAALMASSSGYPLLHDGMRFHDVPKVIIVLASVTASLVIVQPLYGDLGQMWKRSRKVATPAAAAQGTRPLEAQMKSKR